MPLRFKALRKVEQETVAMISKQVSTFMRSCEAGPQVTEARIGHLCSELELSRKPSVRM